MRTPSSHNKNSELANTPESYRSPFREAQEALNTPANFISRFISAYTEPTIKPKILSFGSDSHVAFSRKFLSLVQSNKSNDLMEAIKNLKNSGEDSFINMSLIGDENTPLTSAVEAGHFFLTSCLIAHGADLNMARSDLNTPLSLAVKSGNKMLTELLLARKVNCEIVDADEKTPLWLAMESRKIELAMILLANGAKVNCQNKSGETLLSVLSAKGYSDMVEIVINRTSNLDKSDIFGDNALILAVRGGHRGVVQVLLKSKKIDINKSDKDYSTHLQEDKIANTPLIIAIKKGYKDIGEMLLEYGANPNISNDYNETPLMFAVRLGNLKMVQLLVSKNADYSKTNHNGDSAIIIAAQISRLDIVKYLLKAGASPTIINKNGDNALIIAARNGNKAMCEILILNGLDIGYKNKLGEDALMQAAASGQVNVINLLLVYKAQPDQVNNFGDSALLIAARSGHHDIIKTLIKAGANSGKTNKYGDNALIIAARGGYKDIVKLMQENGVDVNHQNCVGRDALIIASENGDLHIVVFLLNVGVNLRKNNNGITAYKLSYSRSYDQIAEILHDRLSANMDKVVIDNLYDTQLPQTSYSLGFLKKSLFGRSNLSDLSTSFGEEIPSPEPYRNAMKIEGKLAGKDYLMQLGFTGNESIISSIGSPVSSRGAKKALFQDDLSVSINKSFYNDIEVNDELAMEIFQGNAASLQSKIKDNNYSSDDLSSALLLAALSGKATKISLLLEGGADIDFSYKNGNCAIILAAIHGRSNVVKELLKIEKDVLARVEDKRFGGFIGWDRVCNSYSNLQSRLANQTNHDKDSALILAAMNGNLDIVKILLDDSSCKIDQPNRLGNTPLIAAVQENKQEVVRELLSRGADVNHKNIKYETPLDIAKKSNNLEMMAILKGVKNQPILRSFKQLLDKSLSATV